MKIEGEQIQANFVKRKNRFSIVVKKGDQEFEAFLANPGRLEEILIPGRKLLLRRASGQRKTHFDAIAAFLGEGIVTVDSRLPNALIKEALLAGSLPEFKGYRLVKAEPVFGRGRFDFFLEPACYLEIKGCTLVRNGTALFPDAPTLRGRRHLEELVAAHREGCRAAIIFVVQRDDALVFRPNWEMDPAFGQTLLHAFLDGVEVQVHTTRYQEGEVKLKRRLALRLEND